MSQRHDTPSDSQRWVAKRATPIMAIMALLALGCAAWAVSLWRGGSIWGAVALAVLVVVLVFQVVSTRAIAQHVTAHDAARSPRRR